MLNLGQFKDETSLKKQVHFWRWKKLKHNQKGHCMWLTRATVSIIIPAHTYYVSLVPKISNKEFSRPLPSIFAIYEVPQTDTAH